MSQKNSIRISLSSIPDSDVSDSDAIRNGMKRCTECSQVSCLRSARQVSPLLRWCSRFTQGTQQATRQYAGRSPIQAMLMEMEASV